MPSATPTRGLMPACRASRRCSDAVDAATFIERHGEYLPAQRLVPQVAPKISGGDAVIPSGTIFGDLSPDDLVTGLMRHRTLESAAKVSYAVDISAEGWTKPIFIPVRDGVQLAAQVTRTAPTSRRGTIVFVHGFCGNRDENGLFQVLSEEAARMGFDSISYDWRGIGESDGAFSETDLDQHVADFQEVVSWARSRLGSNALPMYATGFSLGAAVVGLALRRNTHLDSIAYLSPAVRPNRSMWPRYDTPEIRHELAHRGVVTKPGGSLLLGRSMLTALRDTDLGADAFNLDMPLFVCHGTADTRIDHAHTQELVAERGGSGADFGYWQIDGASHSFRPQESHWRMLGAALTTWFARSRSSGPGRTAAWGRRLWTHNSLG